MPSLTLLGPQRFTPTLGEAVARAGVTGRLASVTAGWQEREAEDLELHEHLGERTENLMLYARSEDVLERSGAALPWGRMARPEEIARGVVWLCEPESDYITGEVLICGGGLHF